MRKVRFNPILGTDKSGRPAVYPCTHFDEKDLIEMLQAPRHLTKVNFEAGYQIWGDHLSDIFDNDGGRHAAQFTNLGFARGLELLGYRVVPRESEFRFVG